MQFIRLINHGPENAFFNMALDEAIAESVREKLSPPTLRFYQWDRPSISIGYFQKASDVDLDYCGFVSRDASIFQCVGSSISISSFGNDVFNILKPEGGEC